MKLSSIFGAACVVQGIVGLGFKAQFVNVPEEKLELENRRVGKTLPIHRNYPSRIDAQIVGLGSKYGESHKYLVKKSYEFDVEDLAVGEYELLVHSHDFHIRKNRYRVSVGDNEISVLDDFYGIEEVNATSARVVSAESPLQIEASKIKVYDESPQNKLVEMLMQSPFGFIFRNRLYTILFVVCMGLMILPTAISWFFPDLADQFAEMQKEAYEKRAERAEAEKRAERTEAEKQQAAPPVKPSKSKRRA
ncbi:uncharacterized protein CXQ87_002351 [Candidozyma duobushaemuli]|uniref:ER membrane protein complex subunit 7 beta-sandwich domain-containing protein n=2 Tax=Candidozyma TaxID=3303203 RepID=A0ABX8I6U3_9ASCO|nr:uncharacterized protein CXQ87_002351 [[Candida] duobushaemulonis]PVH14224.1 hypothetical protein CXQ87_002351 [[Candida] duobushaemulonis]QWU87590.1 hypothetical protein CA3LBN_001855 [[Candida] haemuloni]